ncbi:hypothetical protein RI054_07g39090 [Pseudoscourfieldia marina]
MTTTANKRGGGRRHRRYTDTRDGNTPAADNTAALADGHRRRRGDAAERLRRNRASESRDDGVPEGHARLRDGTAKCQSLVTSAAAQLVLEDNVPSEGPPPAAALSTVINEMVARDNFSAEWQDARTALTNAAGRVHTAQAEMAALLPRLGEIQKQKHTVRVSAAITAAADRVRDIGNDTPRKVAQQTVRAWAQLGHNVSEWTPARGVAFTALVGDAEPGPPILLEADMQALDANTPSAALFTALYGHAKRALAFSDPQQQRTTAKPQEHPSAEQHDGSGDGTDRAEHPPTATGGAAHVPGDAAAQAAAAQAQADAAAQAKAQADDQAQAAAAAQAQGAARTAPPRAALRHSLRLQRHP